LTGSGEIFIDRRLDLVVKRRELGVHHDDAVGAHRDGDVSTLALQHIGVVPQVGGLDLDLGEIDVLLRGGGSGKQNGGARKSSKRDTCHDWSPFCDDMTRIFPHDASVRRPVPLRFRVGSECDGASLGASHGASDE
jgi:hypothetical protein